MPARTNFHLYDTVVWEEKRFPELIGAMKAKYGQGPFRVVGVRLHTDEARASSPESHPEAVTIELANKTRQEFSGDWFNKVK